MKLLGSLLVAGALGASVKRSASPKSGRGRSGSPMSGRRSGIASGSPKAPMDSPMDSPMKSGSPEWDFEIPEELMADKEKMEKMMKKFMSKNEQKPPFLMILSGQENDEGAENGWQRRLRSSQERYRNRRRP